MADEREPRVYEKAGLRARVSVLGFPCGAKGLLARHAHIITRTHARTHLQTLSHTIAHRPGHTHASTHANAHSHAHRQTLVWAHARTHARGHTTANLPRAKSHGVDKDAHKLMPQ